MATKEYYKLYRLKNREKIKEQKRLYYQKNKERILERVGDYYVNHLEEKLQYAREYGKKIGVPRYMERFRKDEDFRNRVLDYGALWRKKNWGRIADREYNKCLRNRARYKKIAPRTARFGLEWTQDELDYLVENFGKERVVDIAKTLGRTYGASQRKAGLLGLKQVFKRKVKPR